MAKVGALRSLLDRTVDDTITPVDAVEWFNSALRELASVSRIAAKTIIPIPTDASITSVNLPTNIVELRKVMVEFTSQNKRYQLEDVANKYGLRLYENSQIEWYSTLYPITSEAGRFIAEYYRFPVLLTVDDDTPEIPEIFHNALVFYAAKEFYEADDELALASKQELKFLHIMSQLDDHTAKKAAGTSAPVRLDVRPPWARR